MLKQGYQWKISLHKLLIPKNQEIVNFRHTKKTDVLQKKVSYELYAAWKSILGNMQVLIPHGLLDSILTPKKQQLLYLQSVKLPYNTFSFSKILISKRVRRFFNKQGTKSRKGKNGHTRNQVTVITLKNRDFCFQIREFEKVSNMGYGNN